MDENNLYALVNSIGNMSGRVEAIEKTLDKMTNLLETITENSVKVEQMESIVNRHDKCMTAIKLDLQTLKTDMQDLKESTKETNGSKTVYTVVGSSVVTYLLTKLPVLITLLEGK